MEDVPPHRFMVRDTPENCAKVRIAAAGKFPRVTFQEIGDPDQIREITSDQVPRGQILMEVVAPGGTEVPELMETWARSLNEED